MKNHVQQGFTLVELLIVIALLGALAVGLLASLDPFEQFKKGSDTGTRNTVSEIQQGVIRYYSIKNQMPWGTSGDTNATFTTMKADNSLFTGYISSIIDTGELKKDFVSLAQTQLKAIFVSGDDQKVTVCFQPQSKSFRSDANTKFDAIGNELTGTAATNCPNPTATSCFWCVK